MILDENLFEAENPENREINQHIDDVLRGKTKDYRRLRKAGYEVEYDDKARKHFGRDYFGDNVKIKNPKTDRYVYSTIGKKWGKDDILARPERYDSEFDKYRHEVDNKAFDYKNYLDKPMQEPEDKLTTVQQFKKDKQFLKDKEWEAKRIDAARDRMSATRSRFGLKPQTEALSDVQDKANEVVNPVYADAIRGIKRIDKVREEATKVEETPKTEENPEAVKTSDLKKMHLNESLFEDYEDEVSDIILVISEDGEVEDYSYVEDYEANAHFAELSNLSNKQIQEKGIAGYAHLLRNDEDKFILVDKEHLRNIDTEIDSYLAKINNDETLTEKVKEGEVRGPYTRRKSNKSVSEQIIDELELNNYITFASKDGIYVTKRKKENLARAKEICDSYELPCNLTFSRDRYYLNITLPEADYNLDVEMDRPDLSREAS